MDIFIVIYDDQIKCDWEYRDTYYTDADNLDYLVHPRDIFDKIKRVYFNEEDCKNSLERYDKYYKIQLCGRFNLNDIKLNFDTTHYNIEENNNGDY
jgi:hypothetical protein